MKSLPRPVRRLAVALLGVSVLLFGAAPALAAFAAPQFVRSIGGSGRPDVFAWGVQYNPVSKEMLVSDYLNFTVRRYDKTGKALGNFWRPDAVGQPYTIAVDPRDGSIYVTELRDNPLTAAIAKYDVRGRFLYAVDATTSGFTSPSQFRAIYPVWMTVEEDTGDVLILDSHYYNTLFNPPQVLRLRFNDGSRSVSEVDSFSVRPSFVTETPRLYGIDISDDNVIYLSDAQNRRAYRYTSTGTYLGTFATSQSGGDNRSITVNEKINRVYLVDAEHSDVDVYTLDGTYVSSFGSEGPGPGRFSGGGRQLDVDDDGNVWVGDFGGFEIEKFSSTGTPLLTAPTPPGKPPVGLLAQPRDVAVDRSNGEVWVADAWAQRFQRFGPDGSSRGAWGVRGSAGPLAMNYPRSIAIQPVSRRIWVANERGHHIKVYEQPVGSAAPRFVKQLGAVGQDNTSTGNFRKPVDVEFYTRPGGQQVAVIGDRDADSVKIFDATTFAELEQIRATNNGTAVDPATGDIYVIDPVNDRVTVYNQSGNELRRFGSRGSNSGQFQSPTDAVITGGRLYISDEALSRVQSFELNGTFVGRIGLAYGFRPYDLQNPAGLDADAQGRLYIADSGNDRIQVVDPALPKTFESVAPAAPVVTAPAQGAVLTPAPLVFTGTASDNFAVGSVELSVQDVTTGLWWNASDASWQTTKTSALAAWSSPTAPATSVTWRWVFHSGISGHQYRTEIRTRDGNATYSPVVTSTFSFT